MKDFLSLCKKLGILVCEVLYILKDLISVIIMGIVGWSLCSTKNDKSMIILLSLIMIWACMALRQIHREYISIIKKDIVNKRFTHVDDYGNPYIKGEDLPEVIEYLYRLEEAENVKQRREDKRS